MEDIQERLDAPTPWQRFVRWLMQPRPVRIPLGVAGLVAALLVVIFSTHEFGLLRRQESPPPPVPAVATSPVPKEEEMGKGKVFEKVTRREDKAKSAMSGEGKGLLPTVVMTLTLKSETDIKDHPPVQRDAVEEAAVRGAAPAPRLQKRIKAEPPAGTSALQATPGSSQGHDAAVAGALNRSAPGEVSDRKIKASAATKEVVKRLVELTRNLGGAVIRDAGKEDSDELETISVRLPWSNFSVWVEQVKEAGSLSPPSPDILTAQGAALEGEDIIVTLHLEFPIR
jgi:hypothetical protein